ncbi:putative sulfide quinone reductase protein [Phaeoacremonium minimum UCRPA7]|uniref:Putative sulfide quinone reductase protein n=1 Tax=Phaeoacremonium minimum (strain UCR-PA7) TaxID=1286976 RepID=R8BJP4_PHAM7|nr:putative sulfide quinone reductase protein [Phaeoacremonium minimum UCRPA7]EON99504.1 putative sulfide quinone reductase protein [Phaeoacremonium minimum UCRPA7]
MLAGRALQAVRLTAMTRDIPQAAPITCFTRRRFATNAVISPLRPASLSHKVVIIGGGTAGLAVSHQLLRSGRFAQDDIAVVDPATWHDYQPGWTLVGGGLKNKEDLRSSLDSLIDKKLKFYNEAVSTFSPEDSFVTLSNGAQIGYEQLVVVPGIAIKYDQIKGLPEALADPDSLVSTIYGYNTCDKVNHTINKLRKGNAIFTQPAGLVKCAGAPQKILWMAVDKWKRDGLFRPLDLGASPIKISFATGLPVMFGVPKYSKKLDELRIERTVEGLFQHDLVEINGDKALFTRPDGEKVMRQFDLLHVVPKMGAHAFVANSPLANESGLVDVDENTTRHKKYANIWSIGDASGLPTSKTAAAITSQAPILVSNILQTFDGKELDASYDGYTSCPLITEYGKVMLAEFKYGAEPKETFGDLLGIDQSVPRRAFYHLKKDFFPWVYYKAMVKGTWAGPKGFIR